jgi:pimeloyl-ACP methyl ester carboxylesterase
LLRIGTVWLMKSRAGKVGVNGVSPLVRHILDQSSARLHLVGHSFGARVVLSALAAGPAQKRPARSMLLLQPAVNRWCLAPKVIGTDQPGGYYSDLARVELSIMSTFSKYDFPLHEVFQLAVHTVGEIDIAAVGNEDRYGALGGYGPAGLDGLCSVQSAIAPGTGRYDLGTEVVAVDGSGDLDGEHAIGDHGDINKPVIWWALHCLTSAP